MAYYDLTTSKQIQSVLTVSDEDLPVSVIDDINLDDDLLVALSKALPTWQAVKADETKPANQARLRLFAKYFCAATLAGAAQVFVLKKASDGSNEGQRSDKDGWAFLAQGFFSKANAAMAEITTDLGLSPVLVIPALIGRVIPDRDVITQPRASTSAT